MATLYTVVCLTVKRDVKRDPTFMLSMGRLPSQQCIHAAGRLPQQFIHAACTDAIHARLVRPPNPGLPGTRATTTAARTESKYGSMATLRTAVCATQTSRVECVASAVSRTHCIIAIALLPLLMQVQPDMKVLHEHTGIGHKHTHSQNKWHWSVVGNRILLPNPHMHHFDAFDLKTLLTTYTASSHRAPRAGRQQPCRTEQACARPFGREHGRAAYRHLVLVPRLHLTLHDAQIRSQVRNGTAHGLEDGRNRSTIVTIFQVR